MLKHSPYEPGKTGMQRLRLVRHHSHLTISISPINILLGFKGVPIVGLVVWYRLACQGSYLPCICQQFSLYQSCSIYSVVLTHSSLLTDQYRAPELL